jgi:transposase
VELGASYSNREADVARLRLARMAAETPRPAEGSRKPGQHQRRLSMTEVAELIKEYERGVMVKELAERFGVHRVTVTALLQRQGVEIRKTGLVPEVIPVVARMYSQGWSCARLVDLFDVDASTVWRALRAAGLTMRSPSERPSR